MFLTKIGNRCVGAGRLPGLHRDGLLRQSGAGAKPQPQAKAERNAANQGLSNAVTDLTPAQFGKLHALLRPKADEMRFGEIPWLFNLWEARTTAAAEGKPLLILGAAGNPCGTC